MSHAMGALRDLFFPPRCVFCDKVIASSERPACRACIENPLPCITGNVCARCGREKKHCTCGKDRFLSDGIAAPFYYDHPVSRGLLCMKRVEDRERTRYFAREMANAAYRAYGDRDITYVTSVPMTRRDVRARSFNQAETLARALAANLHIPYAPLLKKRRNTLPQKELSAEERRVNLMDAFAVIGKLPLGGSRILLVDDTLTTGSTTNECAKMLKLYGAGAVYVLTAALTRLKKEEEQKAGESL